VPLKKKDGHSSKEETEDCGPGVEMMPFTFELMNQIVHLLRNNVVEKKLRHRFRLYKNVFVGKKAIDFLIEREFVQSREEGLRLGRALLSQGYIRHVTGKNDFEDNGYFYNITEKISDEENEQKGGVEITGLPLHKEHPSSTPKGRGGDPRFKSIGRGDSEGISSNVIMMFIIIIPLFLAMLIAWALGSDYTSPSRPFDAPVSDGVQRQYRSSPTTFNQMEGLERRLEGIENALGSIVEELREMRSVYMSNRVTSQPVGHGQLDEDVTAQD